MFAEYWLHDFIIYVYLIGLFFSSADLLYPNPRSSRFSYFLFLIVWILLTIVMLDRLFHSYPNFTLFDSLTIYTWILLSVSLIFYSIYYINILYFLANSIGLGVFGLATFFSRGFSPIPHQSKLILFYETISAVSNVFYTFSSLFAVLYLVNTNLLKRKKWSWFLSRLPSLDQLLFFSEILILSGTFFLFISFIPLLIHSFYTLSFWNNSKIWGALCILIVYGLVLYARLCRRGYNSRLAWWNALSFFSLVLNYFLANASFF